MILGCDPWGWRQDNHLAGGVPPLRRGPPLAGRWGALKGPLRPAFENITCQETPFLALPSLGCRMGPFHGVLWIRSVCSSEEPWSHSVGSRPQPEALLPPKAARSRRKQEELLHSGCEPGSILSAADACSHISPHFTDRETEAPWGHAHCPRPYNEWNCKSKDLNLHLHGSRAEGLNSCTIPLGVSWPERKLFGSCFSWPELW